ncbi:sulfatase-like hydrolase/transferase [Thalassoroseus pseudoceratinae]|uniref:sulfatase-like hydrolase/transferase n=1 Tax=Thalassoroseus pseudoceratinae TaxID=2713176 RepID=UPI00141DD281|nr:sulfatase-like hydrolase/transferase [Thalassoroseus pseudoceratinae]
MTQLATTIVLLTSLLTANAMAVNRPNVILVMTDDQGYGDLSCHGNPVLKTPNLDRLYAESVRLTDFHVSPFCTPTRAALMTGNHPGSTGAYRTSSGRTMMHPDEKTVGHLFAEAGYATGMVGKWHLGDNAPHRPQDRGFQDALWHRCGGIGQASDYWGNDYFDDTYERATVDNKQGTFEKFEGYCTDVWFREGLRFVEKNRDKPFFLYIAPNAPHGPYYVAPEWAKPYQGNEQVANANFYGMVANIDHNMGVLRRRLKELGLADNTILIFMTDNGTAAGAKFQGLDSEAVTGFNAGMRGKKSSIYDGGHRVPFFIHWPKGGLTGGRDIDTLAAHIDVLPTLAELCGIAVPKEYEPDGISLKPLLDGSDEPWPRKHHVVQFHGAAGGNALPAQPFAHSVVLTERWRLVNHGDEFLYDIEADPAQRKDVSEEHPEVVQQLREAYQPFWNKVSPRMTPVRIDLGNPDQNPTELCSQDWYMQKGNPPWWFGSIRKLPKVTAPWMVNVRRAGRYRFTLRQWPSAAEKPLVAVRAKVVIAGQEKEMKVPAGCKAVRMELNLPAGPTELWTYLVNDRGQTGGAYFTDVELVPDDESPLETEAIPLRAAVERATPSKPTVYGIGTDASITFNAELDTLKNPSRIRKWANDKLKLKDGSNLSGIDFPALGITSWSADSFGNAAKTIWDEAKLNELTLNFTGHNFGYNDSMRKANFSASTINTTGNQAFLFTDLTGADFSGAALNIAGFSGRMTAFRKAILTGADFSDVTWGLSTDGLTEKTEFFFSGGPGSTSAADKHRAVTFENADLSRITGPAKVAMIKNLGRFDGNTAIGAKYDQAMLKRSGWTAAELEAAGWQKVK